MEFHNFKFGARVFFKNCLVVFLAFLLVACANTPPAAKVAWAGIYSATSSVSVPDAGSVAGKRTAMLRSPRLERETTRIPAVPGTQFGVAYVINGMYEGERVNIRAVTHYPAPGMTNPETGRTAKTSDWNYLCRVGAECLVGFHFRDDWEMVPGTWVMEIWLGSERLLSQAFDVYRP
jgi:hypothetical protein